MRVDAVNSNRQFQRFADFRGVDYSSSPLEVQSNRATDMANLILRDGVLHKRNGFEQVHYLGGTKEITGAWVFNRSDGVNALIYIQGQSVYEYNFSTAKSTCLYTSKSNGITQIATAHEAIENKSNAMVGASSKEKRLYILCGEYLVYFYDTLHNNWVVYNVLDTEGYIDLIVYVPTTTKNITCKNTTFVEKKRITYESINMLTNWRRNELLCEKIEGSDAEYSLDGEVLTEDTYTPYVEFFDADGNRKGGDEFYINPDNTKEWISYNATNGKHIRICENNLTIENGYFINADAVYFIVEFGAKFKDGDKPIKIGNIGAIFGNDGRADRLFVADENLVRYSENTAEYLPNFTYFPATNFVKCGQSGNVTAFLRLANGTLAVFKDVENRQEPSVYYVSGKYIEAGTDELGVTLYDDAFSVRSGNIEENCPSPYGIATLAGDSLFVSKSGVYGIELSGNVAADDRFARERSRIINTKLTKFNLTKAKAVVYDNRYYLAVGGDENEVYVADARYKYTAEGDMSNTFNYEWFRWTDVPVSAWLLKDNELWFISQDNYLCRFTNKYYDKYLTEKGEVVIDDEKVKDGKVYFDKALLPIVERALYAEYGEERWDIANVHDYSETDTPMYAFDAPKGQENGTVNLSFIVPVKAYWKSSVTALGSSIHRKNMYSLSVVVQPAKQSEVSVGYTTRLRERLAMDAEGTNQFDFGDVSFESYGEGDALYQMFSFDAGGFISAYRQRVFERNFVYAQLMFACNSIGDCIVEEMTVEYAVTRKNIGVG